jgi:uncharacterized lipoprotein YmbA
MLARRLPRGTLPVVVALAAIAGCGLLASPRPDNTRFYTLATPAPEGGRDSSSLAVGLGPNTWPGYLDRPQLVTRLDDERILLAASERWAEPLRTQFERGLSYHLMSVLGTDDVVVFPWWPARHIDVIVEVNVRAFEAASDGFAHLDALWTVKEAHRDKALQAGQRSIREPISPGGTEQAVAALGRALGQLGDAIADDVRRESR